MHSAVTRASGGVDTIPAFAGVSGSPPGFRYQPRESGPSTLTVTSPLPLHSWFGSASSGHGRYRCTRLLSLVGSHALDTSHTGAILACAALLLLLPRRIDFMECAQRDLSLRRDWGSPPGTQVQVARVPMLCPRAHSGSPPTAPRAGSHPPLSRARHNLVTRLRLLIFGHYPVRAGILLPTLRRPGAPHRQRPFSSRSHPVSFSRSTLHARTGVFLPFTQPHAPAASRSPPSLPGWACVPPRTHSFLTLTRATRDPLSSLHLRPQECQCTRLRSTLAIDSPSIPHRRPPPTLSLWTPCTEEGMHRKTFTWMRPPPARAGRGVLVGSATAFI
ncbi:hypothetical protein DFH09DRAFT_1317972 [Mycena vulgaris]|nr:hypothetical protein DFH09DRAFT_1317972 [Mycena vulgaris]